MSLLSWLADRLILCPTTQPIDSDGKRREWIETEFGRIEAWVGSYPDHVDSDFELTIVKFPGNGGRAERAGVHPAEIWRKRSEVWTINPHGYGGSEGVASLKKFPAMVAAAAQHIGAKTGDRPMIASGNSLGCISALYLARHYRVNGLLLRNPPPLRNMIRTRPRYAAWNFGMSRIIADEVPEGLDAIENAANCSVNCLLIQSAEDTVVPVEYQDRVYHAYRGPIEKFVIEGAEHHEMIEERQQDDYCTTLCRFVEDVLGNL